MKIPKPRRRWCCTRRESQRYERMLLVRRAGNHWRFNGRDHNAQWFADHNINNWCERGTRIPRSLRKFFGGRARV